MMLSSQFRQPASLLFCLFLACFSGCAVFDQKTDNANLGKTEDTAYYLCSGCHGPKNVRGNFMSPNILGQKQGYLAAKLRDYRDNTRIEPFMNGVCENLSDQEINNLAAYYSQAKPETTDHPSP